MNKKIVFFDADGTILDIKKGVPESTKRAIKTLTDHGHEAFICTGRAFSFVPEELKQMAFTGIIANCGAYIEHHGKVLLDRQVDPDIAEKSLHILRDCHMIPVMEGTKYMYYDLDEYTNDIDWYASLITETLGTKHKPIAGNEGCMEIAKISAKTFPDSDRERACRELEPYYDYIVHGGGLASRTIEYVLKGFSKGVAIATICGVLGFEKEDTVCFGDSNNDIAMFDVVHTKVAMGNSSEEILKRADFVTADMFHDGIFLGLQKLGLI